MKKILLVLSVVVLLAVGCNVNNDQPGQSPTTTQPTGNQAVLLSTVSVSGSTNTVGYNINIYADGSVIVTFQDSRVEQKFPEGTVDVKTLTDILTQAGDVSDINPNQANGYPTYVCAKSVSFGVTETISYEGKTSGDLDCVLHGNSSVPASYENLASFINQVQIKLNINAEHKTPINLGL